MQRHCFSFWIIFILLWYYSLLYFQHIIHTQIITKQTEQASASFPFHNYETHLWLFLFTYIQSINSFLHVVRVSYGASLCSTSFSYINYLPHTKHLASTETKMKFRTGCVLNTVHSSTSSETHIFQLWCFNVALFFWLVKLLSLCLYHLLQPCHHLQINLWCGPCNIKIKSWDIKDMLIHLLV